MSCAERALVRRVCVLGKQTDRLQEQAPAVFCDLCKQKAMLAWCAALHNVPDAGSLPAALARRAPRGAAGSRGAAGGRRAPQHEVFLRALHCGAVEQGLVRDRDEQKSVQQKDAYMRNTPEHSSFCRSQFRCSFSCFLLCRREEPSALPRRSSKSKKRTPDSGVEPPGAVVTCRAHVWSTQRAGRS